MKIITKSEKETFNLGKKIAKRLKGGEVLALTGELGAGKTVFAKGVAAGLGIKKIITSPTFVLMKIYNLPPTTYHLQPNKLVHLDCYRVKSPQEIIDIGATEYFKPNAVTVIEWADKIKKILPKRTLKINFIIKRGDNREILIK